MSSSWRVGAEGPLRGTLQVPGDKSISHRALILNALAGGRARVRGLLESEDVRATRGALGALGVEIRSRGDEVTVHAPPDGFREPGDVVDCGNSGTSMRLLCGVLARMPFFTVLTGDGSLRRRPMGRVVEPLVSMGARISGRDGDTRAPLAIRGDRLVPRRHDLSVASAQVKSALLLAGLECGTWVREPRRSRDHTERMLRAMGAELEEDPEGGLSLGGGAELTPVDVDVPGDLSAAAFWMVAAAIVPGSDLVLPGVGLNPTRAGILDALRAMGANVEVMPSEEEGHEPVGTLRIRSGALRGTRIDGTLALRCLDELPVVAVAAAMAEGETVIADAAELRVKESDRIARVVAGLRSMGVDVDERPDGMVIRGGMRGGGVVDATGDHRIAMAFAVAGAATPGGVTIRGAEAVSSSYPLFPEHLERLRG